MVDRYEDEAIGTMGRNARGAEAMTEVALRPRVSFGAGKQASEQELQSLHEQSHHDCYIANSVTANVKIEPR